MSNVLATIQGGTSLSKSSVVNQTITASFDIFKSYLNSTIDAENTNDERVMKDEEFIKNEIRNRLLAPDITPDERLKLMEFYTTLTCQGGNRTVTSKKENTKRIAVAGAASLLFGLAAYSFGQSLTSEEHE